MDDNSCFLCGQVYNSDYRMATDIDGKTICDKCWEDVQEERDHNFTKHREE